MAKETEKDELEQQAEKAMAELDELVDGTPPALPPSQLALIMAQQHVDFTRRFWLARTNGEVCTIVGDHGEAKQHFEQAKGMWKRIQATRQLAEERGLGEDFARIVAEFEAQEKDKREATRSAAKKVAAKTGTAKVARLEAPENGAAAAI